MELSKLIKELESKYKTLNQAFEELKTKVLNVSNTNVKNETGVKLMELNRNLEKKVCLYSENLQRANYKIKDIKERKTIIMRQIN